MDSFELSEWLNGKQVEGYPTPPDRYFIDTTRIGGSSKQGRGVDVNKSLRIMARRSRKAFDTNLQALLDDLKRFSLDSSALLDLSRYAPHRAESFMLSGGFHLFSDGKAQQWIHPTSELFQKAMLAPHIKDITPSDGLVLIG